MAQFAQTTAKTIDQQRNLLPVGKGEDGQKK